VFSVQSLHPTIATIPFSVFDGAGNDEPAKEAPEKQKSKTLFKDPLLNPLVSKLSGTAKTGNIDLKVGGAKLSLTIYNGRIKLKDELLPGLPALLQRIISFAVHQGNKDE
jgi:hypothetical protein